MKIKRILITIVLLTCIIVNFNYSYASLVSEPIKTDVAPISYRMNRYIGAAVTIVQTGLVIVFFVGLIINGIKLSEANKEYNRLQNEEVENKEEELLKVEAKIKDAKIQIVGIIIFALIILGLSKIQDLTKASRPIRPDRYY